MSIERMESGVGGVSVSKPEENEFDSPLLEEDVRLIINLPRFHALLWDGALFLMHQ